MAGLLDTQNMHWANDKSKFGYRMLQKMGWSEGKGLGVKEDGKVEHVRLRKKTGNQGVGARSTVSDAWKIPGKVAEGLNDVLARLGAATATALSSSEPPGAPALEEKTKRPRGYYGRRAAGKNVNNYSEKDLREIFGGVATTEEPKVAQPLVTVQEDAEDAVAKKQGNEKEANFAVVSTDEATERKRRRKERKERRERRERKELRRQKKREKAISVASGSGVTKRRKSKSGKSSR